MGKGDRILLILDLDETLVYATEEPLAHAPAFRVGPFHVYKRPYLDEFLANCAGVFDLAIWSAGGDEYVQQAVGELFSRRVPPAFVWGHSRCVIRYDPEKQGYYQIKDLKKVKRQGYPLERVLIVDDTHTKVERNYGNAIYITPFMGDPQDDELPVLWTYLASIQTESNVRLLEKRGWRKVW